MFINTLSESYDRLKVAMSLVDWDRGYQISCFNDKFFSLTIEILKTHNMSLPNHITLTEVYHISQEKAAKFDIKLDEFFENLRIYSKIYVLIIDFFI